MPVHDWTTVPSGIFYNFHVSWLWMIYNALNKILPSDYYALAEQTTTGNSRFGPDVLALSTVGRKDRSSGIILEKKPKPKTSIVARSDDEYYRKIKKNIAIRHVSDDRIVAVIEIVSPGNKSGHSNFTSFVKKSCDLLQNDIHLLFIDVFPPGKYDPNGLHAYIWEWLTGEESELPGKPLQAVSYERDEYTTAYVEPFAVNDPLPDMPVFLEPDFYVDLSLEQTYLEAFAATPKRWRDELEPK